MWFNVWNTGAYAYFIQHNPENLDKQYLHEVPNKYLHLHYGLVTIIDKSSKQIVLVVRFLPFIDMTTNEYEEYEMVTTTLITMAKGANVIKTNLAQRTGLMYASGWRGGMFHIPNYIYNILYFIYNLDLLFTILM